ncbi:acetate--CoA ligase [Falsarthrobacter nasiphocae]|uniref:acetate--CoA ligase n=1 Tax=Falsarthrobacter nasiphocae TaxID=189863 RepID=UPI0036079538
MPDGPLTAPAAQHPTLDPQFLAHPTTEAERQRYWADAARRLHWDEPWHTVHAESVSPDGVPAFTWFEGGRLNVAVNCVDRHVAAGRGSEVALHLEGEPGDRQTVTYRRLQELVSQAAHALESLGVGPGDRVVIHLPVILETVVAALACARIGAVHALVFGGFSAEALKFRIEDTGAKVLITSDGQNRRGLPVPVKPLADEALSGDNRVEAVLVVRRTGLDVPLTPGRDRVWDTFVGGFPTVHEPASFDAEHPLFIMYTSGTTGRPKGLVHTSGGYLTQASLTFEQLFGVAGRRVHWCTADLAWVTAHTYALYGPLSNGAAQVLYEGTPDTPHPGRHLEIIERYGVTSYYTAPTLVRTLRSWFPDGLPTHYNLASLAILGTVGEPIDPDTHAWFARAFGPLPHVDTWWQSETGATVCSPLPWEMGEGDDAAAAPVPAGSVHAALPGSRALVVDDAGRPVSPGQSGHLVLGAVPPGIARTVWGNPGRYRDSYFGAFAERGWFSSGDGATLDRDGHLWVSGRADDVLNVSGHRLSSIEIESAVLTLPEATEAGVCAVPDARTGQAVAVFVVGPSTRTDDAAAVRERVRQAVAAAIGPVAKPAHVVAVEDVPKTRSGKIMRRLLGQIFTETPLGDTSSLANEPALAGVRERVTGLRSAGILPRL